MQTDRDILQKHHRFLWKDNDIVEAERSWEKKQAFRYSDLLFKEFCLCDLKLYKEGKVAMRWRTEKEVLLGKGQTSCGNVKCSEVTRLKTWEVNFAYTEHGEVRNSLVKLRLCKDCSEKLNYKKRMKRIYDEEDSHNVENNSDDAKKSKDVQDSDLGKVKNLAIEQEQDGPTKLRKKKSKEKDKDKEEGKEKRRVKGRKHDRYKASDSEDDNNDDSSQHKKQTRRRRGQRHGKKHRLSGSSESESNSDSELDQVEKLATASDLAALNIWKRPIAVEGDENKKEQFDSFLDDIL